LLRGILASVAVSDVEIKKKKKESGLVSISVAERVELNSIHHKVDRYDFAVYCMVYAGT
jgi:hypothetical protein